MAQNVFIPWAQIPGTGNAAVTFQFSVFTSHVLKLKIITIQ